jgi:TRAP-type C4-dicarboxylate transport system permease large subunit
VARAIGVDPVHFGVIFILMGGLGLITPPVGAVLFVGTGIGRISIGETMKAIWPFYVVILAVLLVVAFVPALSLWLPAAMK